MTTLDMIYYYVGELVSWTILFGGAMLAGFKLSESVHHYGGWKAWAIDFFGLDYGKKGEQK